jgi:DNA-binding NarL/FixJ family response regulator
MQPNLPARFCAIETLQRFLKRHSPSSTRFEEIDYAIDLALQPRRVIDRFLLRNVLRDAERVVRRQRRRHMIITESDLFGGDDMNYFEKLLPIHHDSPEAELIASQLADQILGRKPHDARDILILECLIEGCTTREIATRVGVSPAYAFRLARRMRDTVKSTASPQQP